jgi:hypothetical protein
VAQLRLQSRQSKDVKGKCFIKVQNGAAPDNPGPAQPGSNTAGSKAPALGMAAQLVLCLTSYRSTDADSRRESCKKQLLKKQIREAVLCKVQSPHVTQKRKDPHVIMYVECKTAREASNHEHHFETNRPLQLKASRHSKSGHHCLHCDCSIFKLLLCLEGSSAKCHDLGNLGSIDKHARNSGNYWLFFEPG